MQRAASFTFSRRLSALFLLAATVSWPTAFVAAQEGYTTDVPTSMYLDGFGCETYDPSTVDWGAVRDDIIAYLDRPGSIGPDDVPYSRVAPMLVRASFHDAGSHRNGEGGADGSALLTYEEQFWDANGAPLKFMPYVRAALWEVVDNYGISWADAIVVGGVAGAKYLGASNSFPLTFGRCDSDSVNPQVLPAGNMEYREFAQYWLSVGINIKDAAALMGSHSAIDDHEGEGDPVNWSNSLYQAQARPGAGIVVVDDSESEGPNGVEWNGPGVFKYIVGDAHNAPENVQASCATQSCPFMNQFLRVTYTWAVNEGAWASAFASAYEKMTRIGAVWAPVASRQSL